RNLYTNYNLSASPLWDAATVLDAASESSRLIFTSNGAAGTTFEWGNLTPSQKDSLKGTDTDAVGQGRLAYLRGIRSQEQSNSGNLRNRKSRLGDIVNSNLWVVGKPNLGYTSNNYATFRSSKAARPTMIYVGSNDGMLHGFDASNGEERMAYVPLGVYDKLRDYTSPSYLHKYSVDGNPFTGDVYDGSNWKTLLIGTLGAGGKGYFVLDVTNPSTWTTASASTVVVADNTDGSDADIGHLYGEPTLSNTNAEKVVQITRLNNGRWAALMGNGINSSSEKAVLLIQYLDGAKELSKIVLDSTGANGNGLAQPQVIDIDGNGTADLVYAGDHLGNVWKIDLSSGAASDWGSYFKSGANPTPFFVARDTSNARQPITTAPMWATHPIKGLMVAFGTGREVTLTDRTTTSTQTLYALWDNTELRPAQSPMLYGGVAIANGRSDLVEQTQGTSVVYSGRTYYKTSSNPVPYTGASAKRGWYMDWPMQGERSVNNGGMLTNTLLYMRSRIPANGSQDSSTEESCQPSASAAKEYMTILDIVTGKPPNKPMFDTDGEGITGGEEKGVSRLASGKSDRLMLKTGRPGEWISIGSQTGNGSTCTTPPCGNTNPPPCTGPECPGTLGFPTIPAAISWRQLQ
ncbi:MAG: hypothetical protein K2W33_00665, partial [Burkholderiales bacterium]|nr:hypothetical protein [Burkholderiales bacterium]